MPACSLGHDARSLEIEAVIQGRISDAFRHADQCREVNDDVWADLADELNELAFFRHVALMQDEGFVPQRLRQVLPPAGSKIVHAPDGVASGEQLIDRVTADESGGAGD